MLFYIYVDGKPLCSFLTLSAALDVYWPLMQSGRPAVIVKKGEDKANATVH